MTKVPLALLFSAACIENKLGPEATDPVFDTGTPPVDTDTDISDTWVTPDEDCPDQVVPGYPGSFDSDCAEIASVGTFTPELEWEYTAWSTDSSSNSVMMTPVVASLTDDDGDGDADDDDEPDILVITHRSTGWTGPGTLRALRGDGSGEIFSVTSPPLGGSSGIAVGDLDDDGWPEIVTVTEDWRIVCFESDGTERWRSGVYVLDMGSAAQFPAISDMDGDGVPEIVAGRVILNSDGSLRGAGAYGAGTNGGYGATSFPVDIDGDGFQEVVTGNALYDDLGNTIWYNGEADGFVAAADFDHDGRGEIVVAAYDRVRLQDDDGAVLWEMPLLFGDGGGGGPPTIADFDGDGEPEIGVAATATYTVFEGADGSVLWEQPIEDSSSGSTGSAVFDFEGDGIAEVVYADETRLWVFSGVDGAVKLESTEHSSWTVTEYPVIADVDGDDEAEIVVGRNMHPFDPSDARYGIAIFGDADHSWRPGRKIWNQYAYHITNVEDDGSLPVVPERNWDTYNNFRSGDIQAGTPFTRPDLTIAQADLCTIDCDEGRIVIWVNPGNVGAADVGAGATVDVYVTESGVERLVATEVLSTALPVGTYADSIQFTLEGLDVVHVERIRASIRPDRDECDPENNDTVWLGPFCF